MKSLIILIYPKTGLDIHNVSINLPLSVLTVASTLVKSYEVKIIDQRVDHQWKNTLEKLLNCNPLFVGISSMTGSQINFGLEASRFVKERDATIPIVWGGVHPTILPEQTVRNDFIDIVVIGEGEYTAFELANALQKDADLSKVNNLAYKKNGDILRTPLSKFIDMEFLPDIPYDLIDIENYIKSKPKGFPGIKRMLPVITSRGCPYPCTYCCNPLISKCSWRYMSAKKAYQMTMNLVQKFNLDGIVFNDEAFTMNSVRTKELMEMINGEVKWYIQGRMDELAQADLKKCEKNGLIAVQPGIETGSSRILKLIKKRETIDDFITANRALAKTNILTYYNFMMGFPDESIDDFKQSISFCLELLKDNPNGRLSGFYVYTPYPGTESFDSALSKGFNAPNSLEGWSAFSRHHLKTPWIQDKAEMFKTILLTSKIIDGHAFDFLFDNTPFIFSIASIIAKKWYQHQWGKYNFKKTVDIKFLDFIYTKMLKLDF